MSTVELPASEKADIKLQEQVKQINQLREESGAGFYDCERALSKYDYGMEKARKFIRVLGFPQMKKA